MPNFANITVIGHIGKDPEVKYSQSGTTYATFSVAVKTGYGSNAKTTWYNCVIFGKQAEFVGNHIHKGTAVVVNGEPLLDEWTDKNGGKRQTLKITANSIGFAGSDNRGQSSDDRSRGSEDATHKDDPNDDIPF